MIKLSTKPISSPGRAEKFPPPLMRFLRSNAGSRSRGRSRSSPMFFRKKIAAVETQEPSSPKVTCMGQVRASRSKKPSRAGAPTSRRSKWVPNALFCPSCCSLRPVWRRWVLFFQAGSRRKVEIIEHSPKIEPDFEAERVESRREIDEDEEEEEEETEVFVSSSTTPPKNALLLTRSRSAPYRSSSLAGKFWVEETEQVRVAGGNKPTSETGSICEDSDRKSRECPESEEKLGSLEEHEGSIRDTMVVKLDNGGSERSLLLTRCRSEPARTAGEKVGTVIDLRRFAVAADSSSSHVL